MQIKCVENAPLATTFVPISIYTTCVCVCLDSNCVIEWHESLMYVPVINSNICRWHPNVCFFFELIKSIQIFSFLFQIHIFSFYILNLNIQYNFFVHFRCKFIYCLFSFLRLFSVINQLYQPNWIWVNRYRNQLQNHRKQANGTNKQKEEEKEKIQQN